MLDIFNMIQLYEIDNISSYDIWLISELIIELSKINFC